jgi:hypothetical protein
VSVGRAGVSAAGARAASGARSCEATPTGLRPPSSTCYTSPIAMHLRHGFTYEYAYAADSGAGARGDRWSWRFI